MPTLFETQSLPENEHGLLGQTKGCSNPIWTPNGSQTIRGVPSPSFGFLTCEMGLSRAFQGVQEGLRKVEEERTRLAQRLVPKSLFKETRRIQFLTNII